MRRCRNEAGFTLIELLVVITILGIIAGVVVFAVGGIGNEGTDAAVKADQATLRTAEEVHCAKFTGYATVPQLQAKKLLGKYATRKRYNYVSLGSEGDCGTGPRSSFSMFDATAATGFLPDRASVSVGVGPTDVAVNPETNMVYIANNGDHETAGDTVSVMNGDTDTVVGEPIRVGTRPRQITVSPTKNKVYVTSNEDRTVSVIDAGHNNDVTTLPFPASGEAVIPTAVGVNPANGDVYVGGEGTIMRIDGTTNEARDVDAGYGIASTGGHFAFNETTNTVFFVGTGAAGARLVIIDGVTRAVSTVEFPERPAGTLSRDPRPFLAVNPETNKVYVTVTDIKRVANPIYPGETSDRPSGAIVIFDGNRGYAGTNAIGDEVPVALAQWKQITINPGTNEIYAFGTLLTYRPDGSGTGGTATAAGVLVRLDGATNEYTGQAQGAPAAFGGLEGYVLYHHLVVNPTTNRVYVSQNDSGGATGGLLAVDMTTLNATTIGEHRVFVAFAVNSETNKIYAVDRASDSIAVLR